MYIVQKFKLVVFLIGSLALTACGNSGSGGGNPGSGSLANGTFIKKSQLLSTLLWNGQFSSSFAAVRLMHLYPATDIQGSGKIKALRLRYMSPVGTAFTCPNTTIKMGHTNVATLDSVFASNINQGQGALTTVVDNSEITIPTGSNGEYFDIPLSAPFAYNGIDNLVVEISRTVACNDSVILAAGRPIAGVYVTSVFSAASATATTGSTSGVNMHAEFVFSGGDNALIYTGTRINWGSPFTDQPSVLLVQTIYPASDIDGSGPITGIAIPITATISASSFTVTAKLGHFTDPELTSRRFSDNYSDNPVTVVNAATFRVPAGVPSGSYVWLPLNGNTFTYNGVDSLVMEIEVSSPSGTIGWITHTTPGTNTSSFGALPLGEESFDIKLRFNGGTMDVISAGNTPDSYPFHSAVNPKRQYLYMSSQLGTAAVITSVACRLNFVGPTLATDYANFEIVLGNTLLNTLSSNFAINIENPTTVFNGTFSLPAGLIKGDWIEIPLTSPFVVDPTMNLVVQMASDAGANGYSCNLESSSANYHVSTNDRTNLDGFANAYQADLKLGYKK